MVEVDGGVLIGVNDFAITHLVSPWDNDRGSVSVIREVLLGSGGGGRYEISVGSEGSPVSTLHFDVSFGIIISFIFKAKNIIQRQSRLQFKNIIGSYYFFLFLAVILKPLWKYIVAT